MTLAAAVRSAALAARVGPDGSVVGIDASKDMIDYATRERGSTNCQFQVGTTEALSVPSEHFDVVVSSLFMHHLPGDLQASALAEMDRVLRPGGSVVIIEAQVPRERGWRLLARLHGYDRMAESVPNLERLLTDAGFIRLIGGNAPPWLRYVRGSKPVAGA